LFLWLLVVSLHARSSLYMPPPLFTCPLLPHSYISDIFTHTLSQQIYMVQAITQAFWNRGNEEKNESDQPVPTWYPDRIQSQKFSKFKTQISTWIEVNIVSHFSLKKIQAMLMTIIYEVFCFSGMLHSTCWYVSDVSEQPSNPIFKGQLTPKVGLIGCPEMSVNNYQHMLHNITEGLTPQLVTEPCKLST
jgi:hypothetical protein